MSFFNTRRIRQALLYRNKTVSSICVSGYRLLNSIFKFKVDKKIEFLISHNHEIIFLLNPKVASRSLVACFSGVDDFVLKEAEVENYLARYGAYSWYVVIRDPVERAKSCYLQKIATDDPIIKALIWGKFNGHIWEGMTFSEFIDFLKSGDGADSNADRHWKSQIRVLKGSDRRSVEEIYDKIFVLDEIEEIQIFFESVHGLVLKPLEKILVSPNRVDEIEPRALEGILDRYDQDVKLFLRVVGSKK